MYSGVGVHKVTHWSIPSHDSSIICLRLLCFIPAPPSVDPASAPVSRILRPCFVARDAGVRAGTWASDPVRHNRGTGFQLVMIVWTGGVWCSSL